MERNTTQAEEVSFVPRRHTSSALDTPGIILLCFRGNGLRRNAFSSCCGVTVALGYTCSEMLSHRWAGELSYKMDYTQVGKHPEHTNTHFCHYSVRVQLLWVATILCNLLSESLTLPIADITLHCQSDLPLCNFILFKSHLLHTVYLVPSLPILMSIHWYYVFYVFLLYWVLIKCYVLILMTFVRHTI